MSGHWQSKGRIFLLTDDNVDKENEKCVFVSKRYKVVMDCLRVLAAIYSSTRMLRIDLL